MKKNNLVKTFVTTVLLTMLSGCGAVSQADYDKVVEERDFYKQQYEALTGTTIDAASSVGEPIPAEDAEFMEKCRNTTCISVVHGADVENGTFETDYTFVIDPDKTHAEFRYYDKSLDPFEGSADFSLEKFNEVRELLCSTPLSRYTPPTDENGMIKYEILDTAISISNPNDGRMYIADPANKDAIVAVFNSLLESARQ